jgi:hypothetical protein
MDESPHGACVFVHCRVHCISGLEFALKVFLKELSQVFFKKDNLRSKNWWLSAFYAFCIQGLVRRGLMDLVGSGRSDGLTDYHPQWFSVNQYLYIALRLFVATSGVYDPLSADYSPENPFHATKTEVEKTSDQDFKAAQDAVRQGTWKSNGISGSMHYLQDLFDDTGDDLLARPTSLSSIEADGDTGGDLLARPTSLSSIEADDDTALEFLELVNRQREEVKGMTTRRQVIQRPDTPSIL